MNMLCPLIEQIEAEHARHKEQIRTLYARVQKAGLDKSAVGEVVRIRRHRSQNLARFNERSETVNVYLAKIGDPRAYVTPDAPAPHVRAREEEKISSIKARARALAESVRRQQAGEGA